MVDMDLKLDGIAGGILVEKTEKKRLMLIRKRDYMQAPFLISEVKLE